MSELLACPKCSATRFRPLEPRFVYVRNWRGRWVKRRVADIAGCLNCRRIWEIHETGAIVLHEDAPESPKPAPSKVPEDEGDDEPRHALADAVRRPEV